jgi:chromosome segregation ATPase
MQLYSNIINDEINLIAKYIDTYFNINNYISEANLNIPQIQNITNFPRNSKLSSFSNIINSVENALRRICMQNKFNKNSESVLKQEINKLNNILEKKSNEIIELKKGMSDLKKKYYNLKNDFDKINNDLTSQRGFNKQIENTMNDITNGNDDYIKGLYQSVKSELDKILNDPLFHSYLNIIIEQRNNFNSKTQSSYVGNGMKYLFEDTLDKYILINNSILEDYKKQSSDNCGICGKDMGPNIQELQTAIDDLNNKLIQKDKIISNNKDEKKLLINQINILQRDILNLKNKILISPQKADNNLLTLNYTDKLNNNINNSEEGYPTEKLSNNQIIYEQKPQMQSNISENILEYNYEGIKN